MEWEGQIILRKPSKQQKARAGLGKMGVTVKSTMRVQKYSWAGTEKKQTKS